MHRCAEVMLVGRRADDVPQYRTGFDRRQLIRVADEHDRGVSAQRIK